MRRIMLVVTVALVMAAMLMANAMPAFAIAEAGEFSSEDTCSHGQLTALYAGFYNGSPDQPSERVLDMHYDNWNTCYYTDNPPGEGV